MCCFLFKNRILDYCVALAIYERGKNACLKWSKSAKQSLKYDFYINVFVMIHRA